MDAQDIHYNPQTPGYPKDGDLVAWGCRAPGHPGPMVGLARLVCWVPRSRCWVVSPLGTPRRMAGWVRHATPEELALWELGGGQ